VTDGPFAETKELVAGFTIIQVGSREEALKWVERWPVEDGDGEVELELRELYEADDFGEEFTPRSSGRGSFCASGRGTPASRRGRTASHGVDAVIRPLVFNDNAN
jgi:hypothetical protein